jgi:hypothetical protein
MSGQAGRSGRKRGSRQLLRIAIAAALGDVFPNIGAYARGSLAGAILDGPRIDGELQSIAPMLRSKCRVPWVRSWRHGDGGLRATVNGLSAAPDHARRAVVELFDIRTADRAEAALLRLGLSEVEIGRLRILTGITAPVVCAGLRRFAFSYDIRRGPFLALLGSLIRTRQTSPMIILPPALLELSAKMAAISENMPSLARFAPLPLPAPVISGTLAKAAGPASAMAITARVNIPPTE